MRDEIVGTLPHSIRDAGPEQQRAYRLIRDELRDQAEALRKGLSAIKADTVG